MTTPASPARPATASSVPSGLTPKSRRQRRWSLALAGILLVLGSAMVFLLLFVNAGDRRPVLAVARHVPAGQVISGADVQVVRVGADSGVATISEARRSEVLGQTAAVDLLPGALLIDDHLGEPVSLAPDEAVVGLDLVGGERPVPDLKEGDEVLVVLTAAAAGPPEPDDEDDDGDRAIPALGQVLTRARVLAVTVAEDAENRAAVSVVVPDDMVEAVAGANAADRVSLALVPLR